MKTVKIVNLKKFLTTLTAMSMLISVTTAQPFSAPSKSVTSEPLTVKYLGADDDYLTFEITIQTTGKQHPILNIDDKNAGSLYSESLRCNVATQKVKIEKKENQSLSFELIAGKNTYFKTFVVNTSVIEKTTVLEEQTVARN